MEVGDLVSSECGKVEDKKAHHPPGMSLAPSWSQYKTKMKNRSTTLNQWGDNYKIKTNINNTLIISVANGEKMGEEKRIIINVELTLWLRCSIYMDVYLSLSLNMCVYLYMLSSSGQNTAAVCPSSKTICPHRCVHKLPVVVNCTVFLRFSL